MVTWRGVRRSLVSWTLGRPICRRDDLDVADGCLWKHGALGELRSRPRLDDGSLAAQRRQVSCGKRTLVERRRGAPRGEPSRRSTVPGWSTCSQVPRSTPLSCLTPTIATVQTLSDVRSCPAETARLRVKKGSRLADFSEGAWPVTAIGGPARRADVPGGPSSDDTPSLTGQHVWPCAIPPLLLAQRGQRPPRCQRDQTRHVPEAEAGEQTRP